MQTLLKSRLKTADQVRLKEVCNFLGDQRLKACEETALQSHFVNNTRRVLASALPNFYACLLRSAGMSFL